MTWYCNCFRFRQFVNFYFERTGNPFSWKWTEDIWAGVTRVSFWKLRETIPFWGLNVLLCYVTMALKIFKVCRVNNGRSCRIRFVHPFLRTMEVLQPNVPRDQSKTKPWTVGRQLFFNLPFHHQFTASCKELRTWSSTLNWISRSFLLNYN